MPTTVVLPNGMTVFCLQKHEVPLLLLEVDGYLCMANSYSGGNWEFE